MTDTVGREAIRKPLGEALDSEVERLDVLLARLWCALAGVGVIFGLVFSLVVPGTLGISASAASGVLLCWFIVYSTLLQRRRGGRPLLVVGAMVEGAGPWVFLLVAARSQGAAYAMGSWLPPMVYAALVVAATARLRPLVPLVLGASTAVLYPLLYFVYLRGELSPHEATLPLYQPALQISRALSLALGGVFASFIALALRRAIGKAERAVRAQDLFGKYRIGERIAAGGMGSVHKAVYCPEGGFVRPVAVKLLHPHLAEEPAFLSGFRNEAELCARLVHPNIVQVLDFGRTESAYFLAMEYVDGLTLLSFMRRLWAAERAVPSALAAWMGREILAGLAYSHEGALDPEGHKLRVVHRDLCPHNVLVSRGGEVKISDFGIARALRDAQSSQTRTVAGHLGYMAPEQAQAAAIDERSDIFAVGVMLWELLAGRTLFYRGSEAPTLIALLSTEVPKISEHRPDVPSAWDAILLRAAARDPGARFASAAELARALEPLCPAGGYASGLAELVEVALAQEDPGWTKYALAPFGEGDVTDREAVTSVR